MNCYCYGVNVIEFSIRLKNWEHSYGIEIWSRNAIIIALIIEENRAKFLTVSLWDPLDLEQGLPQGYKGLIITSPGDDCCLNMGIAEFMMQAQECNASYSNMAVECILPLFYYCIKCVGICGFPPKSFSDECGGPVYWQLVHSLWLCYESLQPCNQFVGSIFIRIWDILVQNLNLTAENCMALGNNCDFFLLHQGYPLVSTEMADCLT